MSNQACSIQQLFENKVLRFCIVTLGVYLGSMEAKGLCCYCFWKALISRKDANNPKKVTRCLQNHACLPCPSFFCTSKVRRLSSLTNQVCVGNWNCISSISALQDMVVFPTSPPLHHLRSAIQKLHMSSQQLQKLFMNFTPAWATWQLTLVSGSSAVEQNQVLRNGWQRDLRNVNRLGCSRNDAYSAPRAFCSRYVSDLHKATLPQKWWDHTCKGNAAMIYASKSARNKFGRLGRHNLRVLNKYCWCYYCDPILAVFWCDLVSLKYHSSWVASFGFCNHHKHFRRYKWCQHTFKLHEENSLRKSLVCKQTPKWENQPNSETV